MAHYVYALADPRDDALRYVGVTNNLTKRKASHAREARAPKTLKGFWLASLAKEGLRFRLYVLEEHERLDEALAAEREWISNLSSRGRLTNTAHGRRLESARADGPRAKELTCCVSLEMARWIEDEAVKADLRVGPWIARTLEAIKRLADEARAKESVS